MAKRGGDNVPGEGERVPLEERYFRAADEDVLARASSGLLLLDLNLHHAGGVLDHL